MSKKATYKTAHTCQVPLYGGDVHLILSRKQMRAAADAYGMKVGDEGFAGQFARLEQDGGKQRLHLIGVYEGGLSMLTHELGHAALDILEVAGIDAHSGNGEPFCYLLGHLFHDARANGYATAC